MATLLLLGTLLSHSLVAQERIDRVEPDIRVLLVQEDREVRGLEATIAAVVAERALPLGRVVLQPFVPAQSRAGLPDPEIWDLAVLVPGPLLDDAFNKGMLSEIESPSGSSSVPRRWLVADVSAYGLVELDEPLRPLPWGALGEVELALPNLEREPSFLDALAVLLRRRSHAGLRKIWWSARQNWTSAELRAAAQQTMRGPAILRLTDQEIPAFEDLLTARLGVAVSKGAPRAMRTLAAELCVPKRLESWLGDLPRRRRFESRLALPPSASEVRAARAFAFEPWKGDSEDLPDWITTLLLAIFVVAFGYVMLLSSKKRGRARLSGSR